MDWGTLLATVSGGFIAISGTVLADRLRQRHEKDRGAEERLVWAYRVAVRGELKDRTFSPASFGWDAWDGRERCPVCREELTAGA
ncbi:hypothetical protein [Streptomyces anulatus]|uniref:hypothetical protein n=1 Tax=Streptomyces anulatus TaxID=1892 RepID=UPI00255C70C7|nr:hypothetical protein [Streptomyces anulatus]WIY74448.1 hypothetical protein QPM16_01205 [Streptomyces anulatus]